MTIEFVYAPDDTDQAIPYCPICHKEGKGFVPVKEAEPGKWMCIVHPLNHHKFIGVSS